MKKTELVRQHIQSGETKEALRIAKTFRLGLTTEERDLLVRGYECIVNPGFYRQIGRDTEKATLDAQIILHLKWG
ncbi:MAG: hypothetical protein OEX12_14625 [Gammaproteobacteria bacterium]|nr:hypothetical protein [Gammaproteobacteria bacterium]